MKNKKLLVLKRLILIGLSIAPLLGCTLDTIPTQTPAQTWDNFASPEPNETLSSSSILWTDETAIMNGICFEAALDAVGQFFVIRNNQQLLSFYDLADNSNLCRHPVGRNSFDFSNGRILAGFWSNGTGCTAYHSLESHNLDQSTHTLTIQLRLVTEGTCDYELIRPFWIGINSLQSYEIILELE